MSPVPRSAFRVPRWEAGVRGGVIDSHVHFWNPAKLHYPWLEGIPSLRRAFLPEDFRTAAAEIPIGKVVFVECNCRPEESGGEVEFVEALARTEPRLAGIVAFVDLVEEFGARGLGLGRTLDALTGSPRVKGIRQNIQGQPSGFSLQRAFVEGVREVGRRELTFDLCVTQDQLREVVELVRACPDTRFVLDHCGKPAIRTRQLEPWRTDIARLAAHENVCCKLSGLLTEAGPEGRGGWCEEDLKAYAACVVECFGTGRVMYGSDWPVLTLAGAYRDWYGFTDRFTAGWTPTERMRFYGGNAARVYGL
jgi:L-fuconolactonase